MMTIGKLAESAGVGVETVRFYERKGLVKQPKKSAGGAYRYYSEDDSRKIKFIKRAQELGFTLSEVGDLLKLNANPRATCQSVSLRAAAKIKEVEEKIADLDRIKKSLKSIESDCKKSGDVIACCRIVDCFEGRC